MIGALRTLLFISLVSLLLSGVPLTKVICIHLDTKVAHFETVEVIDSGKEIHLSAGSFLLPEEGKLKSLCGSEALQRRISFKAHFRYESLSPYTHLPWSHAYHIKTVRLII